MKKPEEVPLSAQAKQAAVALAETQKAIRFFRLYPSTHHFARKAVSATLNRLDEYIETHGDLDVRVSWNAVHLGETIVLRESGQSSDLPTLLFPEGVNGLVFQKGLQEGEVADLISILSASYQDTGDDLGLSADMLSALWQREFEHIQLRVLDQLAAGEGGGGGSVDPSLAALGRRIRELVGRIRGSEDADAIDYDEWEPQAGDAQVEEFLVRCEERADRAGRDPATDPTQVAEFRLTPAGRERARLFEELADAEADLLARSNKIVTWVASRTQDMTAEDMERYLTTAALNALVGGDLSEASNLVTKLANKPNRRVTTEHTERLGSIRALELVAQLLEREGQSGRMGSNTMIDRGLVYLSRLEDFPAVGNVCSIYAAQGNDDVRRVLRRFLTARVNHSAEAIAELTVNEDRQIAKEAMGILAMGDKQGKAWALLKDFAHDTEHEYRAKLALKVVGKITGEDKLQAYFDVVAHDRDPHRRCQAAKKLAKLQSPLVFNDLAELVKQKEFGTRDPEEMQLVLGALLKCGGIRAVPILQQLSQKKKRGLFSRSRESDRLGKISAAWLQSYKDQDKS